MPLTRSAAIMIEFRSTRFFATYKDYKVEKREAVTIDGRQWQVLRFTRAMRPAGVERFPDSKLMKTTEYVFHRGNVSFLMNLIAGDRIHDKHIESLRAIVRSIALKPARN